MANLRCAAARDLPINDERPWDAEAARQRILAWADGAERSRQAFLAYDADAEASATCVLPFADVVDGQLVAIGEGLRQAARELPRADGLSKDCREQAHAALDGYMQRLHETHETPEERAADGIMLARSPLLLPGERARQPKSKDELPEELLAHVHDQSVITDESLPYLNAATASTDLVDSYFTRMMPTTLRNYAEDATVGLSMQNSHRVDELALGRTYKGTYKANRGQSPARTVMDFYIPPNLQVTELNTNAVIGGIRWGTINDVSVGFYGGWIRCSICRKPMLEDLFYLFFFGGVDDDRDVVDPDAPCGHLPGVEYTLRDKEGKKTDTKEVAVGEIEDAHCAELSFVFDGATPQAEINGRRAPVLVKAQRMLELGVLTRNAASLLERRYRAKGVRFPDLTTVRYAGWRAADVSTTGAEGAQSRPAAEATPPAEPGAGEGEAEVRTTERPPAAEPAAPDEAAARETPDVPQEARAMPEPTENPTTATGAPAEGGAAASGGSGGEQVATPANPSSSAAADPIAGVRTALVSAGLAPEGFQGDLAARFNELGRELTDLRQWADVGRAARDELVDRCKKAGVRAFGSRGFKEAAYGPILTRGTYAELQDLLESFEDLAGERFSHGRKTEEGDGEREDPPAGERVPVAIPARAFMAR